MTKRNNYLMPLMIWLCITLFYCYQYILRMLPNIVMPELMSAFDVNAAEYGIFAGMYYIGYIVMAIPIGLFLVRFGYKKVLPLFILTTVVGLIPIVYSKQWELVVIGRLLVGIGSSAAVVGALQIFHTLFHRHFSLMLGLMVFFGLITVVYASAPIAELVKSMGVMNAINALIMLGSGLAVCAYVLLPNAKALATGNSALQDIKAVVSNYKLIIIGVFSGLMIGPLEGFADAWGSAFFSSVYGINPADATNIVNFILSGMCIGCVLLPYIAENTNKYYELILGCAVVMATCFLYILIEHEADLFTLKAICFVIGICCGYQIVVLAKASDIVPGHLSGMAGAITNMIMMGFGTVFHNVIGLVVHHVNTSTVVIYGMPVYDKSAYMSGISTIPALMIIAVLGFIGIILNERKRKKRAAKGK